MRENVWKGLEKYWISLTRDSQLSSLWNLSNLLSISGFPEIPPEAALGPRNPLPPGNVWKCLEMCEHVWTVWIRLGFWPTGVIRKPPNVRKFWKGCKTSFRMQIFSTISYRVRTFSNVFNMSGCLVMIGYDWTCMIMFANTWLQIRTFQTFPPFEPIGLSGKPAAGHPGTLKVGTSCCLWKY